jgi:hypothetical protein
VPRIANATGPRILPDERQSRRGSGYADVRRRGTGHHLGYDTASAFCRIELINRAHRLVRLSTSQLITFIVTATEAQILQGRH